MNNTDAKAKTSDSKPSSAGNDRTTVNNEPESEKSILLAIEEDDEFDEFDPCRWDTHDEDAEDALQWQDNWDDDDIEDDFTNNLRAELSRNSAK